MPLSLPKRLTDPRAPALAALLLALILRTWLVLAWPENYAFDGFQRWAGRDHLLVRDWLPLTQSVVWVVHRAGGGVVAMKLACAVVGALACGAGAAVAVSLGGAAAGWCFLPVVAFSPLVTWSIVPYQEGGFLAVTLGALALALWPGVSSPGAPAGARRGALLAADLLAGAAALSRYEGWVFVALYVAWRRDPRAAVALWGAALWLALKGLGLEGVHPSPVVYSDWDGLVERYTWERYFGELRRLQWQLYNRQGYLLLLGGLAGAVWAVRARRRGAALLTALTLGQIAVVLFWMAGVEATFYRMQVVAGLYAWVLAAAALGANVRGRAAWLVAAGLTGFGINWTYHSVGNVRMEARKHQWERALASEIEGCEGCAWVIEPRTGLGSRSRHDGCEILEGISDLAHERDFWCATWPASAPAPEGAWRARWISEGEHVWEGHYEVISPGGEVFEI
jgi:hypothetical protein